MILFSPYKKRQTYSKKYLHRDEEPFFISGGDSIGLTGNKPSVALAICYEISVEEHAKNAFEIGAEVYLSSVAKFVSGIDKALNRLSGIAKEYFMTVLMSNCIGESDGNVCAGKTSIWNNKGELSAQLNDKDEGILIIDTETKEVIEKSV